MPKKEALSMEALEQVCGGIAVWHKSFDTNAGNPVFSKEGIKSLLVPNYPRPPFAGRSEPSEYLQK